MLQQRKNYGNGYMVYTVPYFYKWYMNLEPKAMYIDGKHLDVSFW